MGKHTRRRDQRHLKTLKVDKEVFRNYVKEKNIWELVTCVRYKHDEDKPGNFCKCGRLLNDHRIDINFAKPGEEWSAKACMKGIPNKSYGVVEFQRNRYAPYIRLWREMNMEDVFNLMYGPWGIPTPKLVISVTGGTMLFTAPPDNILNAFKTGITEALKTTGAWVITSGIRAGVAELVGQAVSAYRVSLGSADDMAVALGITSWGKVYEREELEGDDENGMFPVKYMYQPRDKCQLHPAYTHFMLIDGIRPNEDAYQAEIKFRAKLEKYIARLSSRKDKDALGTPVVLLVMEGGFNTVKTALETVRTKRPIVLIKGSGGAADFLSASYRVTVPNANNEERDEAQQKEAIRAHAEHYLLKRLPPQKYNKEERMRKINYAVGQAWELLKEKHLVTVCALDDSLDFPIKNLKEAIIRAVLKAKHSNVLAQIDLAMALDQCDLAKKHIFASRAGKELKPCDLYTNMSMAIVHEQRDFIQLFVERGVQFREYLKRETLLKLYNDVISVPHTDVNVIDLLVSAFPFMVSSDGQVRDLSALGIVVLHLIGPMYRKIYKEKPISMLNSDAEVPATALDSPETHLFLWAVLLNKMKVAKYFWKEGKDQIGTALIASVLLEGLAEKAGAFEESALDAPLRHRAAYFEKLACDVLSECHKDNTEMTSNLLTRELAFWGNDTTLLSIADSGVKMEFMAHTACQTKINEIWKGNMALSTDMLKILVVAFCPVLLFTPWIKFTKNLPPKVPGCFDFCEDPSVHPSDSLSKKTARTQYKVFAKQRSKRIKCGAALVYFYTAPVTKFIYNAIAYLAFLVTFSFTLLTDLHPGPPAALEGFVWFWILTYILEEISQIVNVKNHRLSWSNLLIWWRNGWNKFDTVVYIILVPICIISRLVLKEPDFYHARSFYALTICIFYIRFLQTFYVHSTIGPLIIMIRVMLRDLAFFIVSIFLVSMLSYGVASTIMLYPNRPAGFDLISYVAYSPYWQIFVRDAMVDTVDGESDKKCSRDRNVWLHNSSIPQCAENNHTAHLLLVLYVMLTNVLLLNLLIAIFNNTYGTLEPISRLLWSYHRYGLVEDYVQRPSLVPPLNVISFIYRLITTCVRCNNNRYWSTETVLCQYYTPGCDQSEDMTEFERICTEKYEHEGDPQETPSSMTSPDTRPKAYVLEETTSPPEISGDKRKRVKTKIGNIGAVLSDLPHQLGIVGAQEEKRTKAVLRRTSSLVGQEATKRKSRRYSDPGSVASTVESRDSKASSREESMGHHGRRSTGRSQVEPIAEASEHVQGSVGHEEQSDMVLQEQSGMVVQEENGMVVQEQSDMVVQEQSGMDVQEQSDMVLQEQSVEEQHDRDRRQPEVEPESNDDDIDDDIEKRPHRRAYYLL